MPSSPPSATSNSQPPFTSVLVDTANATDNELLHLIENARAAVERARDVTESFTGSRRGEGEEEEPSDTAAESLFERHTNRRDMELDWDDQDTERRARNLLDRLRENPPPEPLLDLGDPETEEDDELMMGNERYPFGQVHHIGGGYARVAGGALSAGDRFGLPTFGGIEDSDEDDDDDSYVETGEEAIFGFDGDGVDEELEDAAWRYEEEMRRYEDSTNDSTAPRLTSIWPGLLGEQPLNPSRPAAPPTVSSASKSSHHLPPLDPSSSTSFTSFLAPGATFIGEQVTSRSGNRSSPAESNRNSNSQSSSRLRRPAALAEITSTSSSGDQATTVHPAFSPFPSVSTAQQSPPSQGPSSSSSAFHRSADPAQAFLLGPLRPTTSSSSNQASSTADRSSSSRYAPYSSSHAAVVVPPSTSSASTPLQAPIPPNLTPVERARMSIARNNNPAARTNPESWREVGRELLGRSRGEEATNGGEATSARVGPGLADERWGVQVVIHTYNPSTASVTGLMNAYGIQSTHRNPSTHPARVTTFFSATILQPLKSGLFLSPSLTGSGGNSTEGLKVSQSTEAESWIQLGPFKGVSKNELLRLAKDRQWVEDMASGWVLMRWKERDFINVKATESTLSINGFYFVALNRSTGVIEGLYSDPASATPYQRLDLSPSSPDGAFSLATYEMC